MIAVLLLDAGYEKTPKKHDATAVFNFSDVEDQKFEKSEIPITAGFKVVSV